MKTILTVPLLFIASILSAQEKTDSVSFTGYLETYYSYDLNKPGSNNRPAFIYNHSRHNEFNVNLAYIKANFSSERTRANLALATGTYMNANYSAEPGVLKNLFEANAGYKLSRQKNFWLDIGIMPAHIGFESAIGKDNWTLTRSLLAENSPYFETGAKLGYISNNNKWFVSLLALNGWQRISRVDGNSRMSWGTQILYKPSDKLAINYSGFVGSDKPDSINATRVYHNFYFNWAITKRCGLIAGVDIGREDKQNWYAPVGIIRYAPSTKWAVAYRAEYFNDKNSVIISSPSANGFRTRGQSINVDYHPGSQILLRAEAKSFRSPDLIFEKNDGTTRVNNNLSFSMSIAF